MSASQLVDLFETPHATYAVVDSSASDSVYSSVVSLGASLAEVPIASVVTCVDTSPGAAPEDASLSFTLDSGASHCFFHVCTTFTPLPTSVSVALADPTSGLVTARYTTTLPCLAVPSGSLTGFHVPSFSRNLVGVRPLVSQHVGVWIEPSGETAVCIEGDTYAPLATFTAEPGSGLYTLHTGPRGQQQQQLLPTTPVTVPRQVPTSHQVAASPQVAVSGQVLVSGPIAASCSCRSLACPIVLWHHRMGHPSISRLHAMSSLVMEIAHTSMTHTRAPHFLWPYAVRYAAHQLNIWPRVSRPEVSPTSLWTRSPGVASRFRVWGCLALVCDTSADKISPRAVSCVFLGFPKDSSDYTFYHPPLHRFFDSRNILFDECVPYYPPPPGPAPSGVSHATPPPSVAPQVQPPSSQSSSQPTTDPAGASFCGEDPGGASSRGAGVGAESVPMRGPGSGGAGVGAEPVTARDSSLRGAGVSGAVHGGATTRGAPSAGPGEPGTDPVTSVGVGSGGGATGSLESGPGATTAPDTTPPPHPYPTRHQARVRCAREEQLHCSSSRSSCSSSRSSSSSSSSSHLLLLSLVFGPSVSPLLLLPPPPSPPISGPPLPPPDPSPAVFPPPLPLLSPPLSHTWPSRGSPRARPSSPVPFTDLRTALFRSSPPRLSPSVLPSPPELALIASLSTPVTDYYRTYRPVLSHVLASLVTDPRASLSSVSALTAAVTEFASTRCLDYATSLVAAPPTRPLAIGGESALGCDALEDRQFELEFLAAASPHLRAMLLAPEGDPDALDIPTPRTYAEAVSGPWASQWRAAMDSEMASYRSTSTYINEVPPLGANVVDGMWIFRVKRPPGSPPWHDTLRSTLSDLGFQPSSADPSLFARRGSTPFFVLVYVDDLIFATADRVALADVKLELQKRHTCTDLGELRHYLGLQITKDRAARTITLSQSYMVQQILQRFELQHSTVQRTPLVVDHRLTGPFHDEPFEPSGPYAELVGCLMTSCLLVIVTILTLTTPRRTGLLRGTVSAWALELFRGGPHVPPQSQPVLLRPRSTLEAAQELRWLTFLLTDLSEWPSSMPTLFTDNKATILLCREPRLESRKKHIYIRYFLLRELQRRGQARFDFVESEANTADIFTKALPPCDHQSLVALLLMLGVCGDVVIHPELCFFVTGESIFMPFQRVPALQTLPTRCPAPPARGYPALPYALSCAVRERLPCALPATRTRASPALPYALPCAARERLPCALPATRTSRVRCPARAPAASALPAAVPARCLHSQCAARTLSAPPACALPALQLLLSYCCRLPRACPALPWAAALLLPPTLLMPPALLLLLRYYYYSAAAAARLLLLLGCCCRLIAAARLLLLPELLLLLTPVLLLLLRCYYCSAATAARLLLPPELLLPPALLLPPVLVLLLSCCSRLRCCCCHLRCCCRLCCCCHLCCYFCAAAAALLLLLGCCCRLSCCCRLRCCCHLCCCCCAGCLALPLTFPALSDLITVANKGGRSGAGGSGGGGHQELEPSCVAACAPTSTVYAHPSTVLSCLVVPSASSGSTEGGDPTAADTATSPHLPRLETPPGFPPRTSSPPLQPVAADFGGPGVVGGGDAGGAGSEGAASRGARSPLVGGVGGTGAGGAGAGGAGAGGAGSRGALQSLPRRPIFLEQPLSSLPEPTPTCTTPPLLFPPPDSPMPAPNRYVPLSISLSGPALVTAPASSPATACALVAELAGFAATCRLAYLAGLVSASSCPLSVRGELALVCDVLEDTQFELEYLPYPLSIQTRYVAPGRHHPAH
ncbi:unnamed protein product [Closterium sp. NIES-54]